MEEFIIRNYVYRNLSDMLFKMNKLYPELMDDEMLLIELECLKEYVSTLKIKERLAESTESTTEAPQPTPNKKAVRKGKKEKTVTPLVDITTPLFTFDAAQFQSEQQLPLVTAPKKATRKAKANQEPNIVVTQFKFDVTQPSVTQPSVTHQCLARVVSTSGKGVSSHDYMSYPVNSTVPVYGRQCKNVRQNDQTQFCRVHDKKNDYGIFTDEPSDDVKNLCLRKHARLKEIEDIQANRQLLTNYVY
jgi:hypothetical protein